MQGDALSKIFNALQKSGYKIFGPKEQDGELQILELDDPPPNLPPDYRREEIIARPWKYFFTPTRETLYKYEGGRPKIPPQKFSKRALFGISFFDCKALELYDKVFGYPHPSSPFLRGRSEEGDLYYQQNRKNIFVVGYSPAPISKIKTIFFEPNLESAVFDIFCDAGDFYARGKPAEKILKSCGIKYQVLPYKKNTADKKIAAIMKAMEKSRDSKLWDELGEICLACGKCTIACPTCYCFDLESQIGPECKTDRCSGNCFYDDFTRIAGGHKFLNSPKEKIFFWYYHKFVRIPFGYGLPGCTDCGRCTAVCPVGIDIRKNVERLLKENKVSKNK